MIGDQEPGAPQHMVHAEDSVRPSSDEAGSLNSELPDGDYLTLANTIETQIIPRLLRAHRGDALPPREDRIRTDAGQKAIADFARLVIDQSTEVISVFIASKLASGTTLDVVFLDLLAPAADYLGDLWWTDACSFTDVTLALFKLQGLLREFGHRPKHGGGRGKDGLNCDDALLLTAVPGSQHMFGFLMVEEFFRRAGWNVSSLHGATAETIVEAVRADWFAVVGLSMSSDTYAANLPTLIATLRRVSRNRAIVVLVGGAFFNDNPHQVALVGADATAHNARDAVAQAKRLLTTVHRN